MGGGRLIEVEGLAKAYLTMEHHPGWAGVLRDLFSRGYSKTLAVNGVSFGIDSGEIVGLIGPNGAGKTTVLKVLSGILHPSSGGVTVAGHIPQRRERSFLRSIGMVTGQRAQLWPELDAQSAIELVAAAYGVSERESGARLRELAGLMGVEHLLRKPTRSVSLGERMKLEIVAALIHQPQILFLDEPTLGLDLISQRNLRGLLRQCNAALGTTILLTSHYLADIESVCPRTIILNKGAIVYDGPLNELRGLTQVKKVRILGSPESPVLRRLPLTWVSEKSEWQGTVPNSEMIVVLKTIVDSGELHFTIEDPPLEDVISLMYQEEGGGADQLLTKAIRPAD